MEKSKRERIFEIIEMSEEGDTPSKIYDVAMICLIVISLVPLTVKSDHPAFEIIDKITASIFVVDYALRWLTADYKFETVGTSKAAASFVRYPFSFMALIDLVSILPSFMPVNAGLKALRAFRIIRSLRVLRAIKGFRYSKNMVIIENVVKNSKNALITVCALAAGYIVVSALIIFNIEPDIFDNFLEAMYWATVSLTTVGYGDIYPMTTSGQIITMISAFVGIAVVALPSGIITASYMEELKRQEQRDLEEEAELREIAAREAIPKREKSEKV